MRIGGGEFRGRTLRTPKGDATRPTSGMVRETLFNILTPSLTDARFLDLFAGCGSVGLEALSRGATFATFVEKDRLALDCLRGNIATLQVEAQTQVLPYPVERALKYLIQRPEPFDIIFLDPPFREVGAYLTVLQIIAGSRLLTAAGIVIAQHAPRVKLSEGVEDLNRYREREIGDNILSFYLIS